MSRQTPDWSAHEERMDGIESQNRSLRKEIRVLRLAVGLCVALVGAAVLMGATTPSPTVTQAERYLVVDEKGVPRAAFGMLAPDAPGLVLLDKNGKQRVALTIEKRGPGLFVFDNNGKQRAMLDVSENKPHLTLFDEEQRQSVALGVKIVSVYDENGKARAGLFLDGEGTSRLQLVDADGNVTWQAPEGSAAGEGAVH